MPRVPATNRQTPERHSILFNGTSDILTLPTMGNPANITVFSRFKLASGETAGDIADKYSGAAQRSWALSFSSATSLRWFVSNDGAATGGIEVIATVASIANASGWHTAAGTYDGANLKLYLDGIQVGSTTPQTGNIFSSALAPKVGPFTSTRNGAYNGSVDDFMIFNRAITLSEYQTLHAGGMVTSGLLALYTLNEATGTVVKDSSGNNNHATLTGGTRQTDISPASLGRFPASNRIAVSGRV